MFLKTYSTVFTGIIITFTDQNDRPLEIEMTRYSIKPRTRTYVKGYGFLSFAINLSNKYGKKLLNTATKTGLDTLKTASKKVAIKQLKQQVDI